MLRLDAEQLHDVLGDPALSSVGFLNEVMTRHPEAISFAPGAPHLTFLRELDIGRYAESWVGHVCRERGITPQAARRLLYEYGPSQGLINDLVADSLRRDLGIGVEPGALVITVGAQEAMLLTLRALCRPGRDLIAVVDPSYVGMIGAARLLDIGVVGIPEDADGIDLGRLARECRAARAEGRRVRALYAAPDFANPSGTRMDLASRERLLELADREDFLVLEDGAYGFTAEPGSELPSLKAMDTAGRVVHIGTYSKVCLPGARVGFVVADQRVRAADGTERTLARELAALKGMVTVNTSPICQALIGGILLEHGGSLTPLMREKSEFYRRNLALLLDALERRLPTGLAWNRPAGGFFVRIRLPVPADVALLETSASKYGVLWTPMSPFYLGDRGDHEIRLSCSYLDPGRIEEGVARLTDFLCSLV
ncbi:aminotransferase-like domain-containing protein [Streptomyces sp. LZ34]